jgi:integrase
MTVINLKDLSRKAIAELPEDQYRDRTIKGWGLLVRRDKGGTIRRMFNLQYRAPGSTEQRKKNIGDATLISVKQASDRAKEMLAHITLGVDPQAEKDAARGAGAMTFAAAAEQYLKLKAEKLRPNSLRMATMYLTSATYFPTFHKRTLDQITGSDVSRRLDALRSESGPDSTSRALSILSTFFSWCMSRGHCSQNPTIPAAKSKDFKQGPGRDRVLNDDELRLVWNACDVNTDFGRIVRLLLLTGCRRHEVGSLQWSWLDLQQGTMTIPATVTKNRRKHVLALSPMALDILKAVPQRIGNDHVFGERNAGFNSWNYAKRFLNDGIAEEWRLHDIRRSVATGMAEIGIEPHVIETVLNHVSGHKGGVAGIYNRARYEKRVTSALLIWADHVASIISGTEGKVIPLRAS